jgi:hypothetical protein
MKMVVDDVLIRMWNVEVEVYFREIFRHSSVGLK